MFNHYYRLFLLFCRERRHWEECISPARTISSPFFVGENKRLAYRKGLEMQTPPPQKKTLTLPKNPLTNSHAMPGPIQIQSAADVHAMHSGRMHHWAVANPRTVVRGGSRILLQEQEAPGLWLPSPVQRKWGFLQAGSRAPGSNRNC